MGMVWDQFGDSLGIVLGWCWIWFADGVGDGFWYGLRMVSGMVCGWFWGWFGNKNRICRGGRGRGAGDATRGHRLSVSFSPNRTLRLARSLQPAAPPSRRPDDVWGLLVVVWGLFGGITAVITAVIIAQQPL